MWRGGLACVACWIWILESHVWEPRLGATFPLCFHTYHFPFLNPLPQTLNPCAFTHTTSPFRHIPLPFSVTHIPLPLSQPPPLVSCDCNSFVVAACGWCTVETRVITVAGRCWGGMCVTRVTRIWKLGENEVMIQLDRREVQERINMSARVCAGSQGARGCRV